MPLSYRDRQVAFRKACFGASFDSPLVSHSFGVDRTHNLCCELGRKSRRYADASGNPIGRLAESIDRDGDDATSSWSTCMGSNVCGVYASKFHDGTHGRFATNRDLTKLVTDIPANADCEAFAAWCRDELHLPEEEILSEGVSKVTGLPTPLARGTYM